ncbi:hypothetical protein HOY80DRAFT_1075093 [Tuber brumale]|nr:hypothetical protein HOY80DRAFT_1075093 [Tuber brumale]
MCDPPRPPRRPVPNTCFRPMGGDPSRPSHNTCYQLGPGGPTRPSPESDYFSSAAGPSRLRPSTPSGPSQRTAVTHLPMPSRDTPRFSTYYTPMPSDPFSGLPPGVRPQPTDVQEDVVIELNVLSKMVCGGHYHRSTTLDLIPSGRTEGYSVQWECGTLLWTLKICANCEFRRITCSKKVESPNQEKVEVPGQEPSPLAPIKTRFRVIGVWEGVVCEYLLYLYGIGELNEGWWKNDVDLTGETGEGGRQRRYKIWGNHARCHPPLSKRR